MLIRDLEQTCSACPSQWEFRTDDDRPVYVRYRWGYLSVRVGEHGGNEWSAVSGLEIYGEEIGDEYDGEISWAEVERRIAPLDLTVALVEARERAVEEEAAREAEWAREDAVLRGDDDEEDEDEDEDGAV